MSKYLLIAAAVMLLGSSALSFVNKGKLAASIEDTKVARADASSAHQDAAKTRTALNKSQSELKDANQKATDTQAQLVSVQNEATSLKAQVDAAKLAQADSEKKLADVQTQLAALGSKQGGPGTDPAEIAKQIDDLKRQRDELQVVKDGLDAQLKSAQNQVAAAAKREQDRQRGVSMNGLRGRVLAVDRNWNFVVLDLGDRNGVNNNATMIIQRGDSLVGKVKITSVEPSQSIADIIPNSVPPGVVVQAGDTVVFPGI